MTFKLSLHPDTLLAEGLMASTYPLEVVEADRWAGANKKLKGDALKTAVDKQDWDDSIKSDVCSTMAASSTISTLYGGEVTEALTNINSPPSPNFINDLTAL